jgi:hypothetical protein
MLLFPIALFVEKKVERKQHFSLVATIFTQSIKKNFFCSTRLGLGIEQN